MINLDINIGVGNGSNKLTINVESIKSFNRKKAEIEKMLSYYFFEFDTENVRNEIKENVLRILSNDLISTRIEKLKKLNDICEGDNKLKNYHKYNIINNIEIIKK